MKKILGLDLGVTSIGWALIEVDDKEKNIINMGSRIIPLSTDDKDEFTKGNAISKNQKRTIKRTQRKGYDRYQQRRQLLVEVLRKNNMLPDEKLIKLPKIELWELRAKAAEQEVSLQEIGRILLHLNQKRGYKSSRSDANLNKKDTDYVSAVKSRHDKLKESKMTIGQHFYHELQNDDCYRIKQQVYPREAYMEEFDKICQIQQKTHPSILTKEFIDKLKNEIIYYQRKLKSQKGLVSVCDFEGFYTKVSANGKEKEIFVGPKVAPKSSPIFQICKIWETINTITLKNKNGGELTISAEKKNVLFEHLDNNEKLTYSDLFKILELKKEDGWYGNKQLSKGLQGNLTKVQIMKCFPDKETFSKQFPLKLEVKKNEKSTYLVDRKSGEIVAENKEKYILPCVEKEPFYQLWHIIYSIAEKEECTQTLIKKFNLAPDIAKKLATIDFTKQAFGNKSVKAMRKILPYLMEGYVYSDACSFAGYNHSNSLTKDENLKRALIEILPNLPKNSLRQPIVEKILNQMINVYNAISVAYGKPDEVRIELARELKQSKEERNETFTNISKREKENKIIADRLENEYGLRATRNNIIKWRLYQEIDGDNNKTNAICIYCGQPISFISAIKGDEVDIEHIIPKSLLFDDSQSNKTLTHRKCNADKKDRTAYDFMKSKSDDEFQTYLERIDTLYKNGIIRKAKRDKLLMSVDKIPQDFIDRQLRESQYITRKAREILMQVCTNVWATSGSVTEYLRRVWGWDDVLMNLQLPKYRDMDLTEWVEFEKNDQLHKKEVIKGWTKRDDHRHHAIDALTIACTQQGFVQRINTLSSKITRDEMYKAVQEAKIDNQEKKNLLEQYIFIQRPFTTNEIEEKASQVLISFKAGKKVATKGQRKIKKNGKKQVVQTGIIIPRGQLSEENVYGKIASMEYTKPIKYLFEYPNLIFKPYIKKLVEERLNMFNNDTKKALASLKKEPIYLNEDKTKVLEHGTCFKEEFVIKYPIEAIKAKDVKEIVDHGIRKIIETHLAKFSNEKDAFKDLEKNPVWFNKEKQIPIRSVRCFTGLSSVEPIKKDENGKEIAFVKPGNNHHIAFYLDDQGKRQQHLCTFWNAVDRKKYGLPVIINNTSEVWNQLLQNPEAYPESFADKLPKDGWQFLFSLQQNEMFILGMEPDVLQEVILKKNNRILSDHLYRCQKLSVIGNSINIWLRHHLETSLVDDTNAKKSLRFYNFQSIDAFFNQNPVKIRINNLGQIINHP